MRKVFSVMRTEYLNSVRSKGFLIGLAMLPLIIGFTVLAQVMTQDKADLSDRTFAVVDRSGRLFSIIEQKAAERNSEAIYRTDDGGGKKQIRPRFLPVVYDETQAEDKQLQLELSERVRQDKLFAFLIIGAKAIDGKGDEAARIAYFTQTQTYTQLPNWLKSVLNAEIKRIRFSEAGIDKGLVESLSRSVNFKELGLVKVSGEGELIEAEEKNDAVTYGVPAAAMFLLFMLVMMSCPTLLNTVLEEKMQRISELLISSVSPFQLMLGKILGAVCLSLTLSVLYVGAAIGMLWYFELSRLVPWSMYLWFGTFLLLALFMYGSVFAGIGAVCSEMKDAQSLMTPAMILIMLPLFCWQPVLQSPNSAFSTWVSLFPPATPMMMMLRLATSPGPPAWQVALSLVVTVTFTLGCVWAGAKIFRIGILSYGQTPTLGRLVRWIVSG